MGTWISKYDIVLDLIYCKSVYLRRWLSTRFTTYNIMCEKKNKRYKLNIIQIISNIHNYTQRKGGGEFTRFLRDRLLRDRVSSVNLPTFTVKLQLIT